MLPRFWQGFRAYQGLLWRENHDVCAKVSECVDRLQLCYFEDERRPIFEYVLKSTETWNVCEFRLNAFQG